MAITLAIGDGARYNADLISASTRATLHLGPRALGDLEDGA